MSRQAFSYPFVPVNNHASRDRAAVRIPAAKAGIPESLHCARPTGRAQAGCTPSIGRSDPHSDRGSHFSELPAPAYPCQQTALTAERDKPRQPIPASVLRTGHRTRRPQTEADRAARSPSVRTPKQLSYLTAIRHSVPRPACSARAKRNGTCTCRKTLRCSASSATRRIEERGPSASRTGRRITVRTLPRPRVLRGKPDGSGA